MNVKRESLKRFRRNKDRKMQTVGEVNFGRKKQKLKKEYHTEKKGGHLNMTLFRTIALKVSTFQNKLRSRHMWNNSAFCFL